VDQTELVASHEVITELVFIIR